MIRNDELSLYITVNIFSGIYVGVQISHRATYCKFSMLKYYKVIRKEQNENFFQLAKNMKTISCKGVYYSFHETIQSGSD